MHLQRRHPRPAAGRQASLWKAPGHDWPRPPTPPRRRGWDPAPPPAGARAPAPERPARRLSRGGAAPGRRGARPRRRPPPLRCLTSHPSVTHPHTVFLGVFLCTCAVSCLARLQSHLPPIGNTPPHRPSGCVHASAVCTLCCACLARLLPCLLFASVGQALGGIIASLP